MFNKKFFLIATGYILGGLVASKYNKKSPEQLKSDLSDARVEGKKDFDVYLNTFIETHKNLLEDLKTELMSEKNIEFFNSKKEELLALVEDYKVKGEALLSELKVRGLEYKDEAQKQLEELYKEKKVELEELKDSAPEKIEEMKLKLQAYFDEMKTKIEEKVKS